MFHKGARRPASQIFVVAVHSLLLMTIVVVESHSEQAGFRLSEQRHLDGGIVVIWHDSFGDKSVLRMADVRDALHQSSPKRLRVRAP